MWARVNEAGAILELYPRARALRVDDVNYPPGVFYKADYLAKLDIYPVRRRQLNSPEDTHGWKSTESYEWNPVDKKVDLFVTWAKSADYDLRIAERTDQNHRQEWEAHRADMNEFLYSKGYISEVELTAADLAEFRGL